MIGTSAPEAHILLDDTIGKPGNAKTCCCDGKSYAIIRFETPLRMNCDDLAAIHKLPCFGSLR
jgi:hypothetical protein